MNINKPLWISSLLGFLLPLYASAQEPEVLSYQTDFEPPIFIADFLELQDGWRNPEYTASICNNEIEATCKPISGDQSIKVMEEAEAFFDLGDRLLMRFGRPDFYDSIFNESPVIDVHVDARLDGQSTDTGDGNVDDLVSANLNGLSVTDSGPASLGNLLLSSSGDVWIMGSRANDKYFVGVPINQKKEHRLGLRIDFAARITRFFVDGYPVVDDEGLIVTLPFDSAITSDVFAFAALEVAAVDVPDVDPSQYTAYFDNYSVMAFMPIPLDVKPSSCPNRLNMRSRGVLPMAILGTEMLDVSAIDPQSIRLVTAQGGDGISPLRWSMEDVATPYEPYIAKEPACRVSPRETRRVRPMPPGTRAMATTLFVPRPPCGRSGDSTTHQPSPTAPTYGWTGCRMPLQILSAGSGIQHPLRHYDNPYGLYPCLGLPASA